MSAGMRRACLLALAACSHVVTAAAFLWLPWAAGRGVFAGRDFSGPELARLARNLDLLIPQSAGPVATLAALALYGVPVAAFAGVLLVLLSAWTDRPADALRAAAVAGLLASVISLGVILLLSVGPAAGDQLSRVAGSGAFFALGGGVLAGCASRAAMPAATRRTPSIGSAHTT